MKLAPCVILLDGLDELPPGQVAEVTGWLADFKKEYDRQRIIAAAGLWGYGPRSTSASRRWSWRRGARRA